MTHRGCHPRGRGVHGVPPWVDGRFLAARPRPLPRSTTIGFTASLVFWGLFALVVLGAESPPLLVVLMACVVLLGIRRLRRHRRYRRIRAAGTAPLSRHPAPPPRPASPRPEAVWTAARARFVALRSAYAAHECDPLAVLALPALSDVTVPSTARFVDAFAEAQALETDAVPPASHALAFGAAAERAERAWQAARDAAERIRLSHLDPQERRAVDRVVKLLTTARDSDNDAERLAAYARARTELARLDRTGVIHLPRPAAAAVEAGGRGRLSA